MLTEKDDKLLVVLANRLTESVLMNWDEEEVIKLAKEVAVACKENIDFTSFVKKMREAQKQWKDGDPFDGSEMELAKKMCEAESEVDEYLKKMES